MTISLGQSQTFPLDFSDAADLLPGVDGVATSIVQDNGNDVLQIVGSNGTWDNCQVILAQNLNLSDNNNNTITFRFKSTGASTSGQHLLKFEGGTGGAAVAEGFFNSSGTEWETITIDFGAGLGTYSKLVIFTDSGAASNGYNNTASGTYLIDDIAGGTNVAPIVVSAPTVAAEAPSARNAWDVVSIYTDGTYTDRATTNFNPGWGQATVYSPFAISGNNMLKYSNLNYQGIDFNGGINVSAMDTVHLDLWTADCTSFQFFLIGGGENSVTLTPTLEGWNSFDIPMSSYSARTLANIIQMKMVGNGTVYIDNIYFSRAATNEVPPTLGAFTVDAKLVGAAAFDLTAPTSNSTGAFSYTSSNTAVATISGSTVTIIGAGSSTIIATQAADNGYGVGTATAQLVVSYPPLEVAAPTPTAEAEDVISIYSNAYTSVNVSTFRTGWSGAGALENITVEDNATLKYNALNFAGIDINPANQINATDMQNFHIDMWTPDCTTFKVKIVDFGADGTYGGGDDTEHEITRTPVQNGWNTYDIALSEFANLTTRANINQLVLSSSGGTVYVDNMYFWKVPAGTYTYYADADGDGYGAGAASLSTETTAPAGYSVNNTDCNDANPAINPGATEVLNSIDDDCDGLTDEGLLPTIPTTDAPTAPVRNAWDVISLYSSVYTNIGSNFFPNWGQTTTFTNYTPVSDEAIKYSNLTYQGIEIVSGNAPVNVSTMTKLHLDVWTPDLTSFQVVLIAGGEKSVTLTPTQSGWNSYDLDLATQYAGSNLTAAVQLKLERTLWTPTDGNVNSLYLDNIYFYRPATTQPPTLGTFTVPAKVVGDASFDLTAPTSNGSGAFTYTSSNTAVATISGSTVTIVGAGSSDITATQAADETYSSASVIATLEVSLASAAPTPTIPGDRVLSIYSGAAGYSNDAGTNFFPSWGQATQYAQIEVVGNPTLRYSNLNYQGIQLGSEINVSSYDTVHLNVYGAGTSAVDFRLINQAGGAGSGISQVEVNSALTLNPGWNTFALPLSSFVGLDLSRIGQMMFVGSGTIYVDNIFFSKAVPTAVAPTVANIAFCKGSASALTAVASGTNSLKWYTVATKGTALPSAPTPTATKTYYVSQVMSNGIESPRAMIVATINNLPATPSDLKSLESKNICKYIGTSDPVTFTAIATGASSYIWTAPEGAVIEPDGGQAFISFENVSTTAGSIGSVTVKIVDANGCISLPKALALTTVLPKAPASITLTSADTATDFNVSGVPSSLSTLAKITKVGPYIGTSTVFTLTAPEATTAASYSWTLPNGVNQLTGGSSNQITIDFADVAPGITSLPIAVKSVAGCGNSTDKTLTLVRTLPSAPTKLVLTEGASTTAITKVGAYTGKPTELTLTATPILVQGATATSYAWVLPAGVVCTSDHTTGAIVTGSTTTEGITTPWTIDNAIATTSGTITIDFSGVNSGELSFPLSVYAVNGSGNSKAKTLTVTASAPATPSIVGSGGNGTAVQFGTCSTKTYTATLIPGATYNWTVPAGAVIVGESDGNSIEVDYSATSLAINASSAVTCSASNGTGTSAVKSLSVKRVACTSTKLAKDSSTDDFNVIAYPNPSSSDFTIETTSKGAMSVKVYDLQGRLVEKANTDKVGSNLAKGIYNVIVSQGANTKSVRVIKK